MLNDGVKGYRRLDGKIRIRKVIIVAYLVECTHHLAREIQWPF
jgi:altronate hydrolase